MFSARGKVTIDSDSGEVVPAGRHTTRREALAHAKVLNEGAAKMAKSVNLQDELDHIRDAWNKRFSSSDSAGTIPLSTGYVEEVLDDQVIVEKGRDLFSYAYTKAADGSITFGEPVLVKIQYVPVQPEASKAGGAIKALEGYTVSGQAVLFGDADHPDASPFKDFFTKDTDFWLKYFGPSRPMIYDHSLIDMGMVKSFEKAAQSAEEKAAVVELGAAMKELAGQPIIGEWSAARLDPLGLWVDGELDKARRYADYIKRMVDAGILRLSSDSASHLVMRERQLNGANKVLRWPLFGVSVTTHAAEPRLAPLAAKSFFESLGVDPSGMIAKADAEGAKAQSAAHAMQLAAARLRMTRLKYKIKE